MFKYQKTLAPKIWDSPTKINPLVRQSLMMIAGEFIRYLGDVVKLPISPSDIQDAFVHGSITNYYWDKYSDIDLCIVADLSHLRQMFRDADDTVIVNSLKHSWRRTFRISLYGRSVDLSLVDINDGFDATHKKVGPSYSLVGDCWINTPVRLSAEELHTMRRNARIKKRAIMRQCHAILRQRMLPEYIDTYLVNLQKIRSQSMFAQYAQPITSMTMAFKMVRNTGILRRLRKVSRDQRSRKYQLK